MNLKELKDLIALIQGTDINELEIERAGSRIKIKRGKGIAHTEVEIEKEGIPKKEGVKRIEEVPEKRNLITVTSPIVGTFYRSPSQDAKPFVEIGDRVRKGQVLCIIEAMKLMNEIESEVDGKVARIPVENGHPVEYGEPLFLIEPD